MSYPNPIDLSDPGNTELIRELVTAALDRDHEHLQRRVGEFVVARFSEMHDGHGDQAGHELARAFLGAVSYAVAAMKLAADERGATVADVHQALATTAGEADDGDDA